MNPMAYAFDLTRNHMDAEDLVQSVREKFLRTEGGTERFDTRANFAKVVLKNAWISELRKRRYDKEFFEYKDDFDGATEEYEWCCDKEAIYAEIYRLDTHYRDVCLLTYVMGFRMHEVAALLDIPIGTVKSRLNRAVERIKEAMQ